MPSQEDIAAQLERLHIHRLTLGHYLKQRAMQGEAFMSPAVMHGIREAREDIRRIKLKLHEWGVPFDEHPDDEAYIESTFLEEHPSVTALPNPKIDAIIRPVLATRSGSTRRELDMPSSTPNVPARQGSEEKVDERHFLQLRSLLEVGQWQMADEETCRVLLVIVGRQKNGWLRSQDMGRIPCTALRRIDELWRAASGNRFGVSVQMEIWRVTAIRQDRIDNKDIRAFGDRVGWRVNDQWLRRYSEFRFSIDAPEGHLPSLRLPAFEQMDVWWEAWRDCIKGLLLRTNMCFPECAAG